MTGGAIRKDGHAGSKQPNRYPELKEHIKHVLPRDYDPSSLKCFQRNTILGLPSSKRSEGIYPSGVFLMAQNNRQGGTNAPLDLYGTPTVTGDQFPSFCMDGPDVLYKEVIDAFNAKNKNINQHVYFSDLLMDVFEFHDSSLTLTSLAEHKSDVAYEKIRNQIHEQWKALENKRAAAPEKQDDIVHLVKAKRKAESKKNQELKRTKQEEEREQ